MGKYFSDMTGVGAPQFITKECLKRLQSRNMAGTFIAVVLIAVGMGGGICVLRSGLFTEAQRFGIVVALFGITVIGVWRLRKALQIKRPEETLFGQVVLSQMEDHERFPDVLRQIDRDISDQATVKIGEIYIGRDWLVGDYAVKSAYLCGIYSDKHLITLVDLAGTIVTTVMHRIADQKAATRYLRHRFPLAAFEAGIDFEQLSPVEAIAYCSEQVNPSESPLCRFQDASGVPTSNFTLEMISSAIAALGPNRRVGMDFLNPLVLFEDEKINALCVERLHASAYELQLYYDDAYNHPCRAVTAATLPEVQTCFARFCTRFSLPDPSTWTHQRSNKKTSFQV